VSELAAAGGGPVKREAMSSAQGIPPKFLENILGDLRQARLVRSQRGAEGGYWLAKPAEEISIADIMRAVDGPLVELRGEAPEDVAYEGPAGELSQVWIAVRASIRGVVEHVSIADLVAGKLPAEVTQLARDPEAWQRR
jgi:Rrf2 family protein